MCFLFTSFGFLTLFPVSSLSISHLLHKVYLLLLSQQLTFFFNIFSSFPPLLISHSCSSTCWALSFHHSLLLIPFSLCILPVEFLQNLHSSSFTQWKWVPSLCHLYRCPSHVLSSLKFYLSWDTNNWEFRADSLYSGYFCDCVSREIGLIFFFPKLALSFSCIPSLIWLPFIYFLSRATLLFENMDLGF